MLEFLAYVGVIAGLAVGLGIAAIRSRQEFSRAGNLPLGRPA